MLAGLYVGCMLYLKNRFLHGCYSVSSSFLQIEINIMHNKIIKNSPQSIKIYTNYKPSKQRNKMAPVTPTAEYLVTRNTHSNFSNNHKNKKPIKQDISAQSSDTFPEDICYISLFDDCDKKIMSNIKGGLNLNISGIMYSFLALLEGFLYGSVPLYGS